MQEAKKRGEVINIKSVKYAEFARKLVLAGEYKKKSALLTWRRKTNEMKKIE